MIHRSLSKLARRGFSIVEVAILVIVVGIIGTGLVIPLTSFLTIDSYEREEVEMQRAKRAVMGYAARRRTDGVMITLAAPTRNIGGVIVNHATVTMPPNRPYLPCPDINGDGLEDRNFYDRTGERLTISLTLFSADPTVTATVLPPDLGGNAQPDLKTIGTCSAMRGLLPWRTLGLPPTDTWGNRRTYAVDAAFSHKLVGFNESTLGDNFWQHVLLTAGGNPSLLGYDRRDTIRGTQINNADTRNYARPIGLCLGITGFCRSTLVFPGSRIAATTSIAFGSPVTEAPPLNSPPIAYRKYRPHDLINGLPFIIVSHGKNGRGAANAKFGVVQCRASETAAGHEFANYPFVYIPYAGTAPSNFACGYAASSAASRYSPQLFTKHPRNDYFDDVLVWATRDNLINALSNGTHEFAPDLPLVRTQ